MDVCEARLKGVQIMKVASHCKLSNFYLFAFALGGTEVEKLATELSFVHFGFQMSMFVHITLLISFAIFFHPCLNKGHV